MIPELTTSIRNVLTTGERDPYMIQDKLKTKGTSATLDQIREVIGDFKSREEAKFAETDEIKKHFDFLSKTAAMSDKVAEFSLRSALSTAFNNELGQILLDTGDINLEAKKKAAEAAVNITFAKRAAGKPVPSGVDLSLAIYNLIADKKSKTV